MNRDPHRNDQAEAQGRGFGRDDGARIGRALQACRRHLFSLAAPISGRQAAAIPQAHGHCQGRRDPCPGEPQGRVLGDNQGESQFQGDVFGGRGVVPAAGRLPDWFGMRGIGEQVLGAAADQAVGPARREGGQAVPAFRSLLKSGRFDDACRSMVRRRRARIPVRLSSPASKPALAA